MISNQEALVQTIKQAESFTKLQIPDTHKWCLASQIRATTFLKEVSRIRKLFRQTIKKSLQNTDLNTIVKNLEENSQIWFLEKSKQYLDGVEAIDNLSDPCEFFLHRILFYYLSSLFLNGNAALYLTTHALTGNAKRLWMEIGYPNYLQQNLENWKKELPNNPNFLCELYETSHPYNRILKIARSVLSDVMNHHDRYLFLQYIDNPTDRSLETQKVFCTNKTTFNWYSAYFFCTTEWMKNDVLVASINTQPKLFESLMYRFLLQNNIEDLKAMDKAIELAQNMLSDIQASATFNPLLENYKSNIKLKTAQMLQRAQKWVSEYPSTIGSITQSTLSIRNTAILMREELFTVFETNQDSFSQCLSNETGVNQLIHTIQMNQKNMQLMQTLCLEVLQRNSTVSSDPSTASTFRAIGP